jgi:TRAP-type C4-dicarboxylate transport system substrate-binding protein
MAGGKVSKKTIKYWPVLAVWLCISLLMIPGFTAAGQIQEEGYPIKMRYADQNAPSGWEATEAAQPWLEQVEAVTDGRVQVEAYFSESLVKGSLSWDATRQDISDMAWMFHGYWGNQTTLANVLSLPLMPFKNARQASGIFWQLYEQYPKLWGQFKDNHVLITWASTPYFLVTVDKQVKTLEDMKGLKIRVPNGPPVEVMKALGAIPVPIGMPDTYLYLQKGVIDGAATCWEALLSWKQYEMLKYYTYIPLFTVYFSLAMNKDTWDNLPPDIQKQINSVSGLRGSLFWGENMFDTAVSAGREKIKRLNPEVTEYILTEEELARWEEVAIPIRDAWVKDMVASGYPEAQDILDTTLRLIESYNP